MKPSMARAWGMAINTAGGQRAKAVPHAHPGGARTAPARGLAPAHHDGTQNRPSKDVSNIKNHGLSLAAAAELEWDLLISHADDTRHDCYEQRMVGFAPIGNEVDCVVFVEREDDVLRVISLRKATKQEVRDYANQI